MTIGQRRSWERRKLWPAGEYTLLADSHTTEDGVEYFKGDTLTLGEREATRLGYAGVSPTRPACAPWGLGPSAVVARNGMSTSTTCGSSPGPGRSRRVPRLPAFSSVSACLCCG